MSVGTALMTADEFLALPNDGVERWLVRGEVREFGMMVRNRWHSRVEARVVQSLLNWLDLQPLPRGAVYSGEAGFRLATNPDQIVGIDVALVSAEVARLNPRDTTLVDGVPTLAVEISSPSDTFDDIENKVQTYLDAGVRMVWQVNSRRRTIEMF